MSNTTKIYDLKLHEAIAEQIYSNGNHITTMLVTRVPGGFLYSNNELNIQTFVPYNEDLKYEDKKGEYGIR